MFSSLYHATVPAYPHLSCLSANANGSVGYAASGTGDLFVWSLLSPFTVLVPLFSLSATTFAACQAHPTLPLLYVLSNGVDSPRLNTLLLYNTNTLSSRVIASFDGQLDGQSYGQFDGPSYGPSSLHTLAIDFTHDVAVVATDTGRLFYPIPLTAYAQTFSHATHTATTPITAMAFSPDARTLYYAAPGVIYRTPAQAGHLPAIASPTTVVSSSSRLVFADSLHVHGTGAGQTLYVKDGGSGNATSNPQEAVVQGISAVDLTQSHRTATTLLATTTLNLPPGLILTSPATVGHVAPTGVTSLIFTTDVAYAFLSLVSSSQSAVSSSAVSSSAVALLAVSSAVKSSPVTSARATFAAIHSAAATSPVVATSTPTASSAVTSALATSSATASSTTTAISSFPSSSSSTDASDFADPWQQDVDCGGVAGRGLPYCRTKRCRLMPRPRCDAHDPFACLLVNTRRCAGSRRRRTSV